MKGFASNLFRRGGSRSNQAATLDDADEKKVVDSEKPAEDDEYGDQAQVEQLPVLLDRAYDLMAANLFQKAVNRGHLRQDGVDAVFLRKAKKQYV